MATEKTMPSLSIIFSVVTSVAVAAVYIGNMEGRLKTLEADRDYSQIKKDRENLFLETGKSLSSAEMQITQLLTRLKEEMIKQENKKNSILSEFQKDMDVKEFEVKRVISVFEIKLQKIIKNTERNKIKLDRIRNKIKKEEKKLAKLDKQYFSYLKNSSFPMKKVTIKQADSSLDKNIMESSEKNNRNNTLSYEDIKKHNDVYVVRLGSFVSKERANNLNKELIKSGFPSSVVLRDSYYRVEIGSYDKQSVATSMNRKIKKRFPNGRHAKKAIVVHIK